MLRYSSFLLVLVMMIASMAIAQAPCGIPPTGSNTVDWAQFRFDPCHSGFNPYEFVLSPATVGNLGERWHNWTGADSGPSSSPAVANGVVYVGSDGGSVIAFSASTGALLWQYNAGTFINSSPAVANGVVYIGSQDDDYADYNLNALNALTGAVLWKYPLGSTVFSPTVANDVVYVGSWDYNVYALNARTGALLWKYTTGYPVESSPAVANGVVYVGSDDDNVYALNARTGALLWKYTTGNFVVSSPLDPAFRDALSPKKSGPDQRVPVISRAISERLS